MSASIDDDESHFTVLFSCTHDDVGRTYGVPLLKMKISAADLIKVGFMCL